jgi:hypothetical protein
LMLASKRSPARATTRPEFVPRVVLALLPVTWCKTRELLPPKDRGPPPPHGRTGGPHSGQAEVRCWERQRRTTLRRSGCGGAAEGRRRRGGCLRHHRRPPGLNRPQRVPSSASAVIADGGGAGHHTHDVLCLHRYLRMRTGAAGASFGGRDFALVLGITRILAIFSGLACINLLY